MDSLHPQNRQQPLLTLSCPNNKRQRDSEVTPWAGRGGDNLYPDSYWPCTVTFGSGCPQVSLNLLIVPVNSASIHPITPCTYVSLMLEEWDSLRTSMECTLGRDLKSWQSAALRKWNWRRRPLLSSYPDLGRWSKGPGGWRVRPGKRLVPTHTSGSGLQVSNSIPLLNELGVGVWVGDLRGLGR